MRNHDYKTDQKVFRFINSEECETFYDLNKFIEKNNLPFYERWAYYFLGKHNSIDEQTIEEMAHKGYTNYGGYIWSKIYYWKEYLSSDEFEARERIRTEIDSNSAYSEEVNKIFYDNGWDFVYSRAEQDLETQNDSLAQEDHDNRMSNFRERDPSTDFCESCQNSPCICSDREKTSTTFEF